MGKANSQKFAEMKARQVVRIRELDQTLRAAGFDTLDAQAHALALSRSTTWAILKSNHKSSGLSAAIINRMLAVTHLPPLERAKLIEYLEEKIAGGYGHSETLRRKFSAKLRLPPNIPVDSRWV